MQKITRLCKCHHLIGATTTQCMITCSWLMIDCSCNSRLIDFGSISFTEFVCEYKCSEKFKA